MKGNFLIIAIVMMIIVSLGPHYLFGPDEERIEALRKMGSSCSAALFEITRDNSARGERDGQLYGYINLSPFREALSCGEETDVQTALAKAVQVTVEEWWRNDRFAALTEAEIHLLIIPEAQGDDRYKATDFDAAEQIGVLTFSRDENGNVALSSSLFVLD